jgi:tRNA(adenine34) deaminase
MQLLTDEYFMRMALAEAEEAFRSDEVPVGAVIVVNGRVIARTHNLTETLNDVTAHAEMMALTAAADALGGKYLPQCTLYVTVEPCPMCAGALGWSQIGRIVYGADDPKRGYSRFSPPADAPKGAPRLLHPRTVVTRGVLADEASRLMTDFFRRKRR